MSYFIAFVTKCNHDKFEDLICFYISDVILLETKHVDNVLVLSLDVIFQLH